MLPITLAINIAKTNISFTPLGKAIILSVFKDEIAAKTIKMKSVVTARLNAFLEFGCCGFNIV